MMEALFDQIVAPAEGLSSNPGPRTAHHLAIGGWQAGETREEARPIRRRSLHHLFELEECRGLDDLLDPLGVIHTGQLDEDPVSLDALPLDHGFGDTELIDAVVDGLQTLAHRLIADETLDIRFEGHGPTRAALGDVVVGEVPSDHVFQGLAVGARWNLHRETERLGIHRGGAEGHALVCRKTHQSLGGVVQLGLDGVVGLDLKHQMNSTFEVKAPTDFFLRWPERPQGSRYNSHDHDDSPQNLFFHSRLRRSAFARGSVVAHEAGHRRCADSYFCVFAHLDKKGVVLDRRHGPVDTPAGHDPIALFEC